MSYEAGQASVGLAHLRREGVGRRDLRGLDVV